jgi:hypothetical protein
MASQSDRMSGYGPPSPEDRPSDPDAIRREIEHTRAELAGDVDRLADRTSPKRVVRRNVDKIGSRFSNMKESVMGAPRSTGSSVQDAAGSAAGSVKDAAGSAAGSVKDAAGTAADAVRDTPRKVARQTRGNPLADRVRCGPGRGQPHPAVGGGEADGTEALRALRRAAGQGP